MKADFNYDEFPGRFAHCLNEKCVRRDTCLRHQVWLRVPQTRGGVYIINPGHLASLTGEECPFFLLDQPQRFARGITCLFDDIPLRKAETIKSQLIAHLGRNTYYRCKQKKRLVRPKEHISKSCSLPKALPKSRNMTNIWSIMIWIEIDS